MTQAHHLPALHLAALADAYARAQLDVEELLLACHGAILAAGQAPAWISLTPPERLRARAAALRQARAAGADLPLFGVPFAVKDNIDVAGLPTTAACPGFAYVPAASASAVARLEAAGAVVMGKTNLDQFATGLVGTRSPYGAVPNSFDPAFISGGSSAGSAVVVAQGLVSFALGTDTAGSGRVPAALNNIIGQKPSLGLVSTRGVVPACRSLDCVSVFAGSTADSHRVLSIMAGHDAQDAFSRDLPASLHVPALGLGQARIGVPAGALDLGPLDLGKLDLGKLDFLGDEQARELFGDTITRLRAGGAQLIEFDAAPFLTAAALLYGGPWVAERAAAFGAFAQSHPDAVHPVITAILASAAGFDAVDAFRARYALAELIAQAAPVWRQVDAIMLPTVPTTYRIEEVLADPLALNANLGRFTNFTNLMDLAAIALPAGIRRTGPRAGQPFGVTLMAPAGQDGMLAALADALHRSLADARIGATATPLAMTPCLTGSGDAGGPGREGRITLAVVGAHLSGQPLNHQLTSRQARLIGPARTAAGYALYALANTTPAKPGLVRDPAAAGGIALELWSMSAAAFGSFTAEVPPPLCIGNVTLEDGSSVKGFLCESCALQGAEDITSLGGWRAYLAARAAAPA